MTQEEMLLKMDLSYQAYLKEQEIINGFIDALEIKAKVLVSEYYAEEINSLSAEGYKALSGAISRHACNMAVEVSEVFHHHLED